MFGESYSLRRFCWVNRSSAQNGREDYLLQFCDVSGPDYQPLADKPFHHEARMKELVARQAQLKRSGGSAPSLQNDGIISSAEKML
jgi:hypothetical protein